MARAVKIQRRHAVTRCALGWDNILKSFSFYHLLCVSLNGLNKPPHSEWVHQFSYDLWAGASVMVIVKQWQDGVVISRAGRLQLNKEHQQMWCHPFLFGTTQIFLDIFFLCFWFSNVKVMTGRVFGFNSKLRIFLNNWLFLPFDLRPYYLQRVWWHPKVALG